MKTTNSSAWYFVTEFVVGTAHSPNLSLLDYWFWGAMDRLIHLKKKNSIPALKRLINEAAKERAVADFNHRVHLCIRNNGAHFETEMLLDIFILIKCGSSLLFSIFSLFTDFIG